MIIVDVPVGDIPEGEWLTVEAVAALRAGEPVMFRFALSDEQIQRVTAAIWADPTPDLPESPG